VYLKNIRFPCPAARCASLGKGFAAPEDRRQAGIGKLVHANRATFPT
jgi:hypothetical protein